MNMARILTLILTMGMTVQAWSKVLTKEEEAILQAIREKGVKAVESPNKKKNRFNKKLRVVRDDNRISSVQMSVNDRIDLMICYNNPVIIKLGETISESVNAVYLANNKFFGAKKLERNEKAVLVTMNDAIKKGNFQSTLWIERSGDKRSYVFNLIAESCPEKGILPYPVEVIVQDKLGVVSKNQRLLLPSDLIMEVTKNLPRQNDRNAVRVNGMMATANSQYVGLGVSIVLKDEKMANKETIKKPKFVFLDSLKVRTIDNKSEYLAYSSEGETKVNGVPTLRFNIMLNISKKYIHERRHVYMLVIYEDFYQMVKIPVKKLHENLKKQGLEV